MMKHSLEKFLIGLFITTGSCLIFAVLTAFLYTYYQPSVSLDYRFPVISSTRPNVDSSSEFLTEKDRYMLAEQAMDKGDNCEWLKNQIKMNVIPRGKDAAVTTGGFSVQIPFSDEWRVAGKKVNIFDMHTSSSISFGTSYPFEGCTLVREHILSWEKIKPIDQVMQETKKQVPLIGSPVKIKLGEWSGYVYRVDNDMCENEMLTFNAKNKTFTLSSVCGDLGHDWLRIAASIK